MSLHLFYMDIEMSLMSIISVFNIESPNLEEGWEEEVLQT